MKTFFQLREELENLNEAEDSKVTSSIEKKDPDAMHLATHGKEHVYIGGSSDRENHTYHVHNTGTNKTKTVSLNHGGKAMSHGEVKKAAGASCSAAVCKTIHSDHKDELSESTIHEAAIHSKGGTTVHHSDEDRAENYTIKHGGKTHSVSTGPHLFKKSADLEQNDIAGHVHHHISQQAPNIPSHAKAAIVKHMESMY